MADRRAPKFTCLGWLIAAASLTAGSVQAQEPLPVRQIAAMAQQSIVTVRPLSGGEAVALGSGFIVREDGMVVTNLHVVEDADAVRVVLPSGEIYDNVLVVGQDARRDLIILQIPATGLPALPIGDERTAEVGDQVYVMGNPLGLEGTFSNGLLSNKRLEDGVAYLQITAPISEGSSGGPVMDSWGRVIGVATMMFTEGQNLNIAVAARYATGLLAVAGTPTPFDRSIIESARRGQDAERIDTSAVMEQLPADTRTDIEALQPWQRQVALRIIAVQSTLEDDGWEGDRDTWFGVLEAGTLDTVEMKLRKGRYQVVGVCDDDCGDLDIAVAGPNGEEVGKDVLTDALPSVEFSVARRGTYVIDTKMEACATDTCFYGIQLFRGH